MKNEIPKLESMKMGGLYALTVNPEAQHFDDHERFERTIRLIQSKLSSMNYEYKLYIEVSPTGRIHGHGFISVIDPLQFLLFDVPFMTKFMTVCIKLIDNYDKWLEYCTKQAHIVNRRLERYLPKISDNKKQTSLQDYFKDIFVGPSVN